MSLEGSGRVESGATAGGTARRCCLRPARPLHCGALRPLRGTGSPLFGHTVKRPRTPRWEADEWRHQHKTTGLSQTTHSATRETGSRRACAHRRRECAPGGTTRPPDPGTSANPGPPASRGGASGRQGRADQNNPRPRPSRSLVHSTPQDSQAEPVPAARCKHAGDTSAASRAVQLRTGAGR